MELNSTVRKNILTPEIIKKLSNKIIHIKFLIDGYTTKAKIGGYRTMDEKGNLSGGGGGVLFLLLKHHNWEAIFPKYKQVFDISYLIEYYRKPYYMYNNNKVSFHFLTKAMSMFDAYFWLDYDATLAIVRDIDKEKIEIII